jgi:hypothetical protein
MVAMAADRGLCLRQVVGVFCTSVTGSQKSLLVSRRQWLSETSRSGRLFVVHVQDDHHMDVATAVVGTFHKDFMKRLVIRGAGDINVHTSHVSRSLLSYCRSNHCC